MTDMQGEVATTGFELPAIDRRKLIGAVAALTAASTVAAPALAGMTGAEIRSFRAGYAVRGGVTINGFFAAPRGKTDLGVVLVMPANDGTPVEEIARGYARSGYLAIAPDFAKAQGRAGAGAPRNAKVAEVMRAVPGLKRTMLGNGRVAVVAA